MVTARSLLVFVLIFQSVNASSEDPLRVDVLNGPLQGKWMTSRDGRRYKSFEGIPYAKKPERFMPPEPPQNWTWIRMATYPRAWCPQIHETLYVDRTEDCLFLNVYIPQLETPANSTSLPVMTWIHGGAYRTGAGSQLGPKYFMDTDVILVTLNYRLGAFGFLSTDDGIVPGNMGLKDMIMALRWIQNNIHFFGGNPHNVTIFGESAGGAAVHTLSISPAAKGLFQRAISQSGTTLCPWGFRPEGLSAAKRLAKRLNCPLESSKAMVECLKWWKSIGDILNAEKEFLPFTPTFTPVVDHWAGKDAILPAHPKKLIRKTEVQTPIIIGQNKNEGFVFALGAVSNGHIINYLNTNWTVAVTEMLGFDRHIHASRVPKVAAQIRQLYFGGNNNTGKSLENMTKLFTDYHFYFGVKEAVVEHARAKTPVYTYLFSYQGKFSLGGVPSEGPSHADELQYLFESLTVPKGSWPELDNSSADEQFSREFISLWSSFGIHGHPVPWLDSNWTMIPFKTVRTAKPKLTLYNIDTEASQVTESEEVLKRLEFWQSVLRNNGDRQVLLSLFFCTVATMLSFCFY